MKRMLAALLLVAAGLQGAQEATPPYRVARVWPDYTAGILSSLEITIDGAKGETHWVRVSLICDTGCRVGYPPHQRDVYLDRGGPEALIAVGDGYALVPVYTITRDPASVLVYAEILAGAEPVWTNFTYRHVELVAGGG